MVNNVHLDREPAAIENFKAERGPKVYFNDEEPVTLTHVPVTQDRPHFTQMTILPGRGFNTFQIRAFLPKRGFVDVLASPPLTEAAHELNSGDTFGNLSFKYGGALLIPFANRLRGTLSKDERHLRTRIGTRDILLPANWKGQKPEAERHAMHGLILNARTPVRSLAQSKTEASVEADLHAGDFGVGWPSSTDLRFRATLRDNLISLWVEAKNVGREVVPLGMGWHPYFNIPSGQREQARLRIPAAKRALVNNYDDVFPTGQVEDVKGTPYDFREGRALNQQFLDDCFFDLTRAGHQNVVAEILDPAANYGLRIRALSPEFRAFQVYAPVDKSFVALEPQFNLADPYGKEWQGRVDTGMVLLAPGQTAHYEVELELFAVESSGHE